MLQLTRLRLVIAVALFTLSFDSTAQTRAQTRAEPEMSYGSVTGHVYLAGSNAPARFVQIALQPTKIEFPTNASATPSTGFAVFQTGLDGTYTMPRVAPGSYYLVTMQRGFVSPFSLYTQDELEHPNAEIQQRMALELPLVTVRPNAVATRDLVLQRGASLNGTIRFDDGTPFSSTNVSVTRQAVDGKWVPLRVVESNTDTDEEGHWSLSGLPPGTYRVGVQLVLQERRRSSLLDTATGFMSMFGYTLNFWLGDTARESQAKSVTLKEDQAAVGEDITIPVSKIHQVSGALVDRGSGQSLNAGEVKVVDADGKDLASASVDSEARTFTLPYVPEGEYKLSVSNARLVRFEPSPHPEDDPFARNRKQTVLREYSPGEIPLIVQGEMSRVNLPVDAKGVKAP